jgi:hypothetical protein
METTKYILLKIRNDNPENINDKISDPKKYFPYTRLRDISLNDVLNRDDVVYNGDYIIIYVTERYRYTPIPIKVYLTPTKKKSNVPKSIDYFKFDNDDEFQSIRIKLEQICKRDVFDEIYPLQRKYTEKIRSLYFESFKNANYVDKKIIDDYNKMNGLTIGSLLSILRYLIETIYPDKVMGDMGVTCQIQLNGNIISYNMD